MVRSLNKCPEYDTKLYDGEVPVNLELPDPLWPGAVAPDMVLSMTQIEFNCVLMQKWVIWNVTVLILKRYTYAQLNCLK